MGAAVALARPASSPSTLVESRMLLADDMTNARCLAVVCRISGVRLRKRPKHFVNLV